MMNSFVTESLLKVEHLGGAWRTHSGSAAVQRRNSFLFHLTTCPEYPLSHWCPLTPRSVPWPLSSQQCPFPSVHAGPEEILEPVEKDQVRRSWEVLACQCLGQGAGCWDAWMDCLTLTCVQGPQKLPWAISTKGYSWLWSRNLNLTLGYGAWTWQHWQVPLSLGAEDFVIFWLLSLLSICICAQPHAHLGVICSSPFTHPLVLLTIQHMLISAYCVPGFALSTGV